MTITKNEPTTTNKKTTIEMICKAIGEAVFYISIPFLMGGVYWLIDSQLPDIWEQRLFIIIWSLFAIIFIVGILILLIDLTKRSNGVQRENQTSKTKAPSKNILNSIFSHTKDYFEKNLDWIYRELPDKLYCLFLLRVPIIAGLIFFSFPLISQLVAPKFLQNIFVMENGIQLILVLVLSTATAVIVISLLKTILVLIENEKLLNSDSQYKFSQIRKAVWSVILFLPTWVILFLNTKETDIDWKYQFAGILSGTLLWVIAEVYEFRNNVELIKETIAKCQKFIENFIPITKDANKGLENLKTRRSTILIVQIIVALLVYWMVIYFNRPMSGLPEAFLAPTLLYILLIITVMTLFVGFASLIFDLSVIKRLKTQKQLLLNFENQAQQLTNFEEKTNLTELEEKTKLYNHTFFWPVILFLIIFSGSAYGAFSVDHYFKLENIAEKNRQGLIEDYEQDFQTAIGMRLCPEEFKQSQSCKKPQSLVLVAASGGGIQASGWMTQVLAGLQNDEDLGHDFIKSIGLISSASGGSVGSMFYLNQFNESGVLSQKALDIDKKTELTTVVKEATEDWLNAVGWGLAYPDLFRFVGLPILIGTDLGGDHKPHLYNDRGYALEQTWQDTLFDSKSTNNLKKARTNDDQEKILTLNDRRTDILAGKIPIFVYNTTLVENGRRFFVSPMKFVRETMTEYLSKSSKENHNLTKAFDFKTLYNNCGENGNQACDITVTTAARLSASFPYVTPMARNDRENFIKDKNNTNILQNYHIADGGYFDNSGALTAMEWLNDFLKYNNDPKNKDHSINVKKVILLQVNAFPEEVLKTNQEGIKGFEVVTYGPLKTLTDIRDSTQLERNEKIADLLEERWQEKGIEITNFTITFPKIDLKGKDYNPPLSWRLTQTQKQNLSEAWQTDSVIRDTVKKMKAFWTKD
jgi:hypothetical protein